MEEFVSGKWNIPCLYLAVSYKTFRSILLKIVRKHIELSSWLREISQFLDKVSTKTFTSLESLSVKNLC